MTLEALGWNPFFAENFQRFGKEGYSTGRISLEHKNLYMVYTEHGEMPGILSGRMYYDAVERQDLPVVGDWVAIRILEESPPKATIHAILPRQSKFSRKEAGGRTTEQPLASNIDAVFILIGLDHNYSARRIERYLTLAWESGANPAVLLSKSDLCDTVEGKLREAHSVALGAPVHAISVVEHKGLEILSDYLGQGRTIALLGSSGVGKSTLINYLLGDEIQQVREVRQFDGKGRHTTTHRQLFILPSGALMIDTPGMRELQLWNADEGLTETFQDIEELSRLCRFSDCQHRNEPGCRIQEALRNGLLDWARFENYLKMQKELNYLSTKQDHMAQLAEKRKWKIIHKAFNRSPKKQ